MASISTPVTVITPVPAVAVRTKAAPPVEAQVPPKAFGVEMTTPAGKVSVKPISAVAVALLDMVNVSVDG